MVYIILNVLSLFYGLTYHLSQRIFQLHVRRTFIWLLLNKVFYICPLGLVSLYCCSSLLFSCFQPSHSFIEVKYLCDLVLLISPLNCFCPYFLCFEFILLGKFVRQKNCSSENYKIAFFVFRNMFFPPRLFYLALIYSLQLIFWIPFAQFISSYSFRLKQLMSLNVSPLNRVSESPFHPLIQKSNSEKCEKIIHHYHVRFILRVQYWLKIQKSIIIESKTVIIISYINRKK